MIEPSGLDWSSSIITAIIGSPFEWCQIAGGLVKLEDASRTWTASLMPEDGAPSERIPATVNAYA